MSKHEIDTEKLLEDSYEMKKLIANLDTILTRYVEKMQKVPAETKEWQGMASQNFMEIVKYDYQHDYVPLINILRKYAAEMESEAGDYKSVPASNKINDEDLLR